MAAASTSEHEEKPPVANSQAEVSAVKLAGFCSSWLGFSLAFLWVLVIQLVGVYYLTTGFLLTRPVLDIVNTVEPELSPVFNKAVIVVVDALRFDFVMPADSGSASASSEKTPNYYYHDNFPLLYDYTQKNPQNSFLLKFIADPPTTTLQRLKGLTTGSLPAFVDAGSNFAGTEILEDSWVSQLYSKNKTIAFMGDDTWSALFSSKFEPQLNFPYPSLNVWDLDTVDNGVIEHLIPLLDEPHKWDVAIGHLLGVDHAGHRYGPNHPAMKAKLEQMNLLIQQIMSKIDDETLLVVMGDHGMDNKGDHGGDSTLEVESTVWFYSKKKGLFNNEVGSYDTAERGKRYRQVNQIDLVPTLSLLLGIPIPYNNLGFPILEAFPKKQWDKVAQATVDQIETYRKHVIYDGVEHQLASDLYQASKDYKSCSEFQSFVLSTCHERWVEFNMVNIYIGLAIVVASLGSLFTLYYVANNSVHADNINVLQLSGLPFGTGIIGGLIGYALFEGQLIEGAAGLAFGGLAGFLLILVSQVYTNRALISSDFKSIDYYQWLLYFVIVAVHCALFASNSFTVWEDSVLNYITSTFAFIGVVNAFGSTKRFFLWHSVAILVLLAVTSYSRVCREEQSSTSYQCKSTFYASGSSTSSVYAVVGHLILALLVPQLIKAFFLMTGSYTGSAPLYIGIGLHILMALSFFYWATELLENTQLLNGKPLLTNAIRQTKLSVARIGLGASFVAWVYSWVRGNVLCVELNVEAAKKGGQSVIKGYKNIYGSHYFLFILAIFSGFLFVNKPMGDIVLSLMIYLILSVLERVSLDSTNESRASNKVLVALTCMTGMSFFFKTGHQVAIPAIQWDIGFVPSYSIAFPFTHLAIAFNTFGGIILAVLVVPLFIIWGVPPSKAPRKVIGRIASKLVLVSIYYTILAVMSMTMAIHFRRHLMVWKVFAPRYMFSALSLLTVDVTVIVCLLASGYTVKYISSIFV